MSASANALKKPLHIRQRADGDAHASHFAGRERMVGIHAHLGRKIERNREPSDALRQQIAVAAVALLGSSEAGVLPHGPEAAAVHVRVYPSSERILPRQFRAQFCSHDLEILRARKKEWIPNPAMISPNGISRASRGKESSLPQSRQMACAGSRAKTMKKKPIT